VCDFPWGPGDGRQQAQGASEPDLLERHNTLSNLAQVGLAGRDGIGDVCIQHLHCTCVFVFVCLFLCACSHVVLHDACVLLVFLAAAWMPVVIVYLCA
jgi:hypothetical protein